MEVNNTNIISIKNSSSSKITIIVEYVFFTEELNAGSTFKIKVSSERQDINLLSFFEVEYQKDSITVFLNNDMSNFGAYNVKYFLNDECIYEQQV